MADFAREIALKILYKIDTQRGYSNIVLDEYMNKYREKLSRKDINLISEIVYGTVSWKLTIDYILQKYSNIKLKKISSYVLNILRMGTYQILFLDKIPKSAAVNESVNLTKKYAFKSANFVNAILRKIEKSDYTELNKIEDKAEKMSLQYSIPQWLVEEILNDYSFQQAEQICKNSNEKPKMTVRINSLKINKQQFIELLEERKIEYEETDSLNFVNIKNVKNIGKLDLFKNGFCTVQDLGAGKIGTILSPKPNDVVLDACSAPGGKTTHIAELMENRGTIVACDIHSHRIKLVEDNAKRLGINIIRTQIHDMTHLEEKWVGKFDKVLLDVPCLGFGVIKRKPDIKWQRNKEDIEEITKLQFEILNTCVKYVKNKGELVYSTCSILKKENEEIIRKLINSEKDKYKVLYSENIHPNKDNDGFFFCKIQILH